MKTPLTLKVATRAQTGRSASRRLRKVNRIPAILYGKHSAPEKLSIEVPEFTRLLKSVAGRSLLIELNREDKPEKALSFLQEIQRDPITDRYLHVDLHEVKPDEKFEIRVPVRVTGESFGVKNQSGVLEIASHVLRVRCLPSDLPEAIEIDVTPLNVGETIKVGELKPVAGVIFLDDKGQPVVACVEPVAEIVQEIAVAAAARRGRRSGPGRRGRRRRPRGRRQGRTRRGRARPQPRQATRRPRPPPPATRSRPPPPRGEGRARRRAAKPAAPAKK